MGNCTSHFSLIAFSNKAPSYVIFQVQLKSKDIAQNLPITPEVKGMIVYADEPGRLSWKEFDSFVSRSHYNVITALIRRRLTGAECQHQYEGS